MDIALKIKFSKLFVQDEYSISYSLLNEEKDEIGSVEGYVNEFGVLISVVKVYPGYQKKGIGFHAFRKIFDKLNTKNSIQKIRGAWCKDDEFQDFENGMSSNLKLYLECRVNGNNMEECAFATATGKWAKKLGFHKCEFLNASESEVIVDFYK